jgi:hypothetical protein
MGCLNNETPMNLQQGLREMPTATETKPRRAGGVVSAKTSPFQTVTLAKLPEILDGRSRTNFGWEDLTKVKQAKEIPHDNIDGARTSIVNFSKSRMNIDGSGPRFTIMPKTGPDGNVIAQTTEVNGEEVIVKDGRGNPKPAMFYVVRVPDYEPAAVVDGKAQPGGKNTHPAYSVEAYQKHLDAEAKAKKKAN